MKIREFLSYKNNCPVCSSNNFKILLQSTRKQEVKIENDRLVVRFDLLPLTKDEVAYAITYYFGLDDNSFFIDFHNKSSYKSKEYVPLDTIRRFRTLDTNLRRYVIIKLCKNCHKYYYVSETFRMDYKNCSIGELIVNEECFRLDCKLPSGRFRSFTVSNSLTKNTTTVEYSQTDDEPNPTPPLSPYRHQSFHGNKRKELTFDLIELSDPEGFIERLNNLIVFF
jgi:hypothetical protein